MALLYNMGLLYHRYANTCYFRTHDAPSNSTFIISALDTYDLLIRLCNDFDIWNASSTQESCSHMQIIQMLAFNNLGEIWYQFGKYDKYQYCMKNMQHQLQFLSNLSRNDNTDVRNLEEFETICNDLRLNAILALLFSNPILASAA